MLIRPVLLLILLFCGVSAVQAHSNDCMEIFAGKPSKTISFDMTPHRIFEIHEDKSSFKMQFYFSFDYPVEKQLPNQMFFCDGVPESFGARTELKKVFNPRYGLIILKKMSFTVFLFGHQDFWKAQKTLLHGSEKKL